MKFFDRLLTIIVTATLTSAVWIVFGGALFEMAEGRGSDADVSEPAPQPADRAPATPAAPSPSRPSPSAPSAPVAPVAGETPSESAASGKVDARKPALAMPVEGVAAADLVDTFLDPRGPEGIRRHEAIDIMAPKGTPVIAAAPGRIAKIHRSDAGGRSIYVRSDDRKTLYFYAHLDAYADGLKEGGKVDRGQELGTVGTSGNADGDAPHLHFAMFQTTADAQWWEPANALNPYPLLTGPAR